MTAQQQERPLGQAGRPDAGSASQLRREASKARRLANAAFGEGERRELNDVAKMLDREAVEIEASLA